jgi:hypothetical protein
MVVPIMTTSSQGEDSSYSENIIGALAVTKIITKLLQFKLRGKWQSSSRRFQGDFSEILRQKTSYD